MDIADKDLVQQKITNEIKNREKLLKQTYDKLKTSAPDNDLLKSVLNEYEQYYDSMREEKQKQQNALKIISEHLDNLGKDDISKEDREMLKKDKLDISRKISSIKDELQEIS